MAFGRLPMAPLQCSHHVTQSAAVAGVVVVRRVSSLGSTLLQYKEECKPPTGSWGAVKNQCADSADVKNQSWGAHREVGRIPLTLPLSGVLRRIAGTSIIVGSAVVFQGTLASSDCSCVAKHRLLPVGIWSFVHGAIAGISPCYSIGRGSQLRVTKRVRAALRVRT